MKDCAPPRSRVAGGKMPQQRQRGDDDDCDEEWSMEHPGLSSLSNKGFHYHHLRDDGDARDHHSHSSQTATTTTAGTDRRGSFGGSSSIGSSKTNAPATDDTTVVAIASIMKTNGFGGHDREQRVVHFADDSKNDNANQSSSPSLTSFTAERPGLLPQDLQQQQQRCGDSPPSYSYTNGDNKGGGDYPSPSVNSPILKKTSSVSNYVMTISPNTTIDRPGHQATMQFYYPPPPYGKTATSLSSPIGTTTTNSSISPPPPPPRSTTSSSQEKKMIPLPPPPPPVWPVRYSRRSSTSTLSALFNDAADEVVISSTPLLCSFINDTIHHKNSDSNNICCNSKPKKKEVTFASSTTGGMTATSTMNTIDMGAPTTATTVAKKVSTTDDSGSSSRNSDCNNTIIHRNGGGRRDSVEEQNRKTFKEENSPSMVNVDEQQMMRKTTAHKYQNDMNNNIFINSNKSTNTTSNHGNNTAPTIQIGKKSTTAAIANKTNTAPHHTSSSSAAKNRDLLKRVSTVCDSVYTYLEEFDSRNNRKSLTNSTRVGTNKDKNNNSNAEHDNYTRRHTTENNIINGICKTEEHDQKRDLSFTPGSNKVSSPLVYSRRHSTGNSVPRQHSTSSAKMFVTSPISTATTSRKTAATSNRRDGGSLKSRTESSSAADSSNDRSFSDVPSPQDLKPSLPSVVRGRQRISRIHSSSHCTTIADTVAPSSATTPSLQQQPKQEQQRRQRQYLRSTSMDGSAYRERRRGERRHNLHRRSRSSSSKSIIDSLTKQVNTNRRNFHRSSSEGDGDDARRDSLLTSKSLLQQLRTSLDDAVAARRGFSRSGKEHFDHQQLGNFAAAAADASSAPSGQKKIGSFSKDCDGDGVIATEKSAADDKFVARKDRCNSMKDSSRSSTPSFSATANGGILPKRAVVGRGRRGSGCSSTESLSAADTNSDCESLISVLRSYRGEESKGEEGRKKGRKKLLDVGGLARHAHRRRGSSLSRNAAQMLSTMDSPGRDCGEDSKASMVYDIPFDPITGKCHHHSMVQMAVREDDDDNEKKKQGGISFATTSSDSTVLFGWRIVRTTCPKCKYNY